MNKAATTIETATEIAPLVVAYTCQVIAITPLSANTFQIELQLPNSAIVNYQAGQYLQLELDLNNDGKSHSLFYSIANSFDPKQHRRLQLFIQNNSELAENILKRLDQLSKNNTEIDVILPMGRAYLQTDLRLTHLLIAAGSGISKIKCLTEAILKQQPNANVNLYWSNKNANEFYLLDEFRNWEDQHDNFNFTPILESVDDNWHGRSGYIYEVVEKDFEALDDVQTYLCGSSKMVYGTIDKLKITGLKEKNCYSDVFEYAPRTSKTASIK